MKRMQRLGLVISAIILAGGLPAMLHADNGIWTNVNGGSWTNLGNWANGIIADGTGNTGDFSTIDITAARTVTLDGNRTIGCLLSSDTPVTNFDWTISSGTPASVLTLDAGAAVPTINTLAGSRVLTITAQIAGTNGLKKLGPGYLGLSASNSYSGVTTINRGVIRAITNNCFGSSAGVELRPVTGWGNVQLILYQGVAISNKTATLCGLTSSERAQLIANDYSTNTWAGDVVITGTGSANELSAGPNVSAKFTIAGNVTNVASANAGVGLRGYGIGIITGNINITGELTMNTGANGGWTLYGTNNSWVGGTWVRGGTLKMGAANVLVASSPVAWYAGDPGYRFLDLNGFNQTIQGLTGNSNGDPSGQVYSATSATLTLNTPVGSNYACKCVITGAVSVVKTGVGTQTLLGTNAYTGSTTVSAGTLTNNGALANANVTVGGGTFTGSGWLNYRMGTTADVITLTSGTLNVSNMNIRFTGTPTLKTYTVVDYSAGGTFLTYRTTNVFASATNVPSGYKWVRDDSAKKVYLLTPPTGTAVLFR